MRAINVMKNNGINSIFDLISLTKNEFFSLPGCGRLTVKSVKSELNKLGLDFTPFSLKNRTNTELNALRTLLKATYINNMDLKNELTRFSSGDNSGEGFSAGGPRELINDYCEVDEQTNDIKRENQQLYN